MEPTIDQLATAFNYSLQHQNVIRVHFHQEMPEIWPAEKINQSKFYELLFKTISRLDIFYLANKAINRIIQRKSEWKKKRIIPFGLRLFDVALDQAIKLSATEEDVPEFIKAFFKKNRIPKRDEVDEIFEYLSVKKHADYQNVWEWYNEINSQLEEKDEDEDEDEENEDKDEYESKEENRLIDDPAECLKFLYNQMQKSINSLEKAIPILKDGRLPDSPKIIADLAFLHRKFIALVKELQPDDESLSGLERSLKARDGIAKVLATLDRLQCLRHKIEPNFSGITYIRQRCDEIRARANDVSESKDTLTEAIQPFHALERLVNEHKDINDTEFDQLLKAVATCFGEQVAKAADRGRLEWHDPDNAIEPASSDEANNGPTALEFPKETNVSTVAPLDPPPQPVIQTVASVELPLSVLEESAPNETLLPPTEPAISPASPPLAVEPPASTLDDPSSPSESTTTQSTVPEPQPFDKALCSFQAFRQAFWLNPNGQVVEAPWRSCNVFATEITETIHQFLDRQEFGVVLLLLCALDDLNQSSQWVLDDWLCVEAISEAPTVISVGVSHARTQRIQAAMGVTKPEPVTHLGLALFLEAIRPDLVSIFSRRDVERLMETKPFRDQQLAQIVDFLFQSHAAGIDPFAMLKVQMTQGPEISREQLVAEIAEACRRLQVHIAQIWSAAGGRIKHTHCRNAWKKFMENVIQPFRDLLPTGGNPDSLLEKLPDLRIRLLRLMEAYTQTMNDAEVLLRDRKTADRSAKELAEMFKELLDSAERLRTLTGSNKSLVSPLPISAVQHLQDTTATFSPIEELCRQIFLCLIGHWPSRRPLRMDPRWLRDHPALLGEIDPEAFHEPEFVSDGLPIRAFRSPRLAAAAILCPYQVDVTDTVSSENHLLAEIRERALEVYSKRPDLLSGLSIAPHLLVESSDRNRLHRSASELGDNVFKAGEILTKLAQDCQYLDLAAPIQHVLQPAIREARNLADIGITHAGLADGLLLQGWIDALIHLTTTIREQALTSYHQALVDDQPHLVEEFEAAIARHDLRHIPSLLGDHEPISASSLPAVRRTPWRTPEQVREITPRCTDQVQQRHRDSGEEIRELIDLWISSLSHTSTRQKFRRLFYRLISGEEGIGHARRKRVFPDGLVRGGFDGTAVHIQCRIIRKMFRQNGLNPTFLPQLADYAEIIFLSPPGSNFRGSSMAADWSRSVSAEGNNALVVFLAPRVNERQRRDILSEFRARKYSAALIDDFDFWRLAMVDDHDFVPFLEIVMEQLRLERISPFSNQDGQHIRLETYVGRKEQAESLAKTAHYSRVFSGRKLGKSALLKQVEIVYDHTKLPSGNGLNVLFVTIAGGDSEDWIVNQMTAEMNQRFALVEPVGFHDLSASERFSQLITTFSEQRQHDSLLIILDEADQFVEEQLANYDRDREKSLSFRMMKLPTRVDSHGLPRVRIILSGYRITHTREGVWANAGGVLRLFPLQESEAIAFIQGALARIGVDIAEHASFIARRCGFQPAILICFGQSLLNRLQTRRSSHQLGEYIAVSANDVAETFNDIAVIEEIRTVVSNNFQGNRVGGVIFDALLLVMQELPPGFPLRDAPRQILDKLREIEPNLTWLNRIDPTPEAEIKRQLRDFIARELLIEEPGNAEGETYRLRFSHYLPVLTQQNELPLTIKQRIDTLMQTSPTRRRGGSILTESSLAKIRYWYDQEKADLCRLVVVGGGWLKALEHPKVGISDRLGDKDERVYSGLDAPECSRLAGRVARPAVILSGIDTLRWALHQAEADSDFLMETVPIQRITEDRIAWWFESARALHFESANALALIAKTTGGIPFLLERFDDLLSHPDGSEITAIELRQALDTFKNNFVSFARKLCLGAPTVCLLERERDLLRMLVLIAEQGGVTCLGPDFCENWEACCDPKAHVWRPPYEDPDDDLALRTLIGAGLISVDDRQTVQLQRNGVEAQLVQAWNYRDED